MSMVLDIEKKDKCQKSDLENALTGAVLKIEVSYAHQCSVLVNVAMVMVSDIEKKDKCQNSDLENALTGAVLKKEVSYAHQLSFGHL
jgi:hypothetical protein